MGTYTLIHVVISLIGIVSGFVVISGFLRGQESKRWTEWFLATTVLTSVTGFGFPATHVTPGHAFGAISLVVLGVALVARYREHNQGKWATRFVISSLIAQYLNVFVLIVQSFQKIPALKYLAPTQTELPFAATHLVALAAFIVAGTLATRRFHTRLSPSLV